jgi:lycopene beta-cyclase
MATLHTCDLAIVGGGLAGGLIAIAVKRRHPEMDVRVIDAAATIGGNHLWSFFASDLAESNKWIVAPLISHGWKSYDVAFPGQARTLDNPYYAIESERLDRVVRDAIPAAALMLERKVLGASARAVVLADGDRVEAKGVIDCRGPGDLNVLECGWQKFIGQELALTDVHDDPRPMVMDASVAQADGFRFVYCLPFTATRMFVEDTYYSDTPTIDRDRLAGRIADYAQARGWGIDRVVREERGALPVVIDGDFDAYWRSGGNNVAKAGARAGLFQPTTSYSLPDAVRMAGAIAHATDFGGKALHELTHRLAKDAWRARGFYRMLNKMLFRAADPEERWRVLARFYTLDAGLIGRFYAGSSTMIDKARLLTGKPPVPIGRAIAALRGSTRDSNGVRGRI